MTGQPDAVAVVAITESPLARALAEELGCDLHGLRRRVPTADRGFDDTGAALAALFRSGTAIVWVGAVGAVVRLLAPHLGDKAVEPPVVAVAEDGGAVVPVLGGHRGGNDLARRIADWRGVEAAVTTAGDRRFGLALDAPPAGWHLANPEHYKGFVADLLGGAPVRIDAPGTWLAAAVLPSDPKAAHVLAATVNADRPGPTRLVYHPERLALGVGCERGADPAALEALVRRALADHDLAPASVAAVVSIDLKADEPAVLAAATALDRPVRFFDAATLEAETPRLANPSDIVFQAVGCHGVAEAAALAAAGPDGTLIVPKRRGDRVTCAIALAPDVIDASAVGRARGRLAVVGLGPGDPAWRTAEADRLVADASDVVGYGLYLDLIGAPAPGQAFHPFPIGAETERVDAALNLAATGRSVVLVSSGDAGIYAMASLVFERLETGERDEWRRVEIVVAPGISAMQAAAARLGAPLGHDFCAISLSDLLTPAAAIERRLRAAAEGDFVVALYNPVSRRRRTLLPRALSILADHRPAATPVAIARNLGRPDETCAITTLDAVDAEAVDMLSLVLVGASTTRAWRTAHAVRVYTPRGYAGKAP